MLANLLASYAGLLPTQLASTMLCQAQSKLRLVKQLSKLESTLDEIDEDYDNPVVMIRGDANASIPVSLSNSEKNLFNISVKEWVNSKGAQDLSPFHGKWCF